MNPTRDDDLIRIARNEVAKARRNGIIKTPDRCSRCRKTGRRIHGHHEDYARPLDLMWLCHECHRRRHAETRTGDKGRSRCLVCKKLIYRHIEDSGRVREVDGGVAHSWCFPQPAA
jgi:transposase-like protein